MHMSMLEALNQLRGRLTISIEHQAGFGLGQAGINRSNLRLDAAPLKLFEGSCRFQLPFVI